MFGLNSAYAGHSAPGRTTGEGVNPSAFAKRKRKLIRITESHTLVRFMSFAVSKPGRNTVKSKTHPTFRNSY
jgi:hypothetical protein